MSPEALLGIIVVAVTLIAGMTVEKWLACRAERRWWDAVRADALGTGEAPVDDLDRRAFEALSRGSS